ncbi:hypothetical protein [Segatella hominis]|uniref:hypothetical protein n=1 Tax=Segatella hominis TaxID=2518605 RepID=UPI003AB9BB22
MMVVIYVPFAMNVDQWIGKGLTVVQFSLASAKTNVMILSNSFFLTKEEEN